MFIKRISYLNDGAPSAPAAAAGASASAGSSTQATTSSGNVPAPATGFAGLRERFGLNASNEGEGIDDYDDLDLDEEPGEPESNAEIVPEEGAEKPATDATDAKEYGGLTKEEFDAAPLHIFTDKDGTEVEFKTTADLDKAISNGRSAEKIARAYKEQKAELTKYKESHENYQQIEEMMSNDPRALLNMFTEDMDDQMLADFVLEKAEFLRQDPAARDNFRKQKAAENLLQERALLEKQQASLKAAQQASAREAEERSVSSWIDAESQKYMAKVPKEYQPYLDRQINLLLMEASRSIDSGKNLYLGEMSKNLAEVMKPLLARTSPEAVKTAIGQESAAAKKANVSRLQAATAAAAPKPAQENLFSGGNVFERLKAGITSGKLQMTH